MLSRKTLLSIATATAIVSPIVSNIDFDFKLQVKSKERVETTVVDTTCNLVNKKYSDNLLVCEYVCKAGDKSTIQKIYYRSYSSCQTEIHERIKLTKRK